MFGIAVMVLVLVLVTTIIPGLVISSGNRLLIAGLLRMCPEEGLRKNSGL